MKTPNTENEMNSTADAQNNEIIEMPNVEAPCNEETEPAAMTAEQLEKTPTTKATIITSTIIKETATKTTIMPTTTASTAIPNTYSSNNDVVEASQTTPAQFVTPAPPTPLALQGGNSHSSSTSSLKKKRNNNKNIAKRIELEMATASATAAAVDAAAAAAAAAGGGGGVAGVGQSSIKTSLSMTSLPPDDEKQESRDVIKAKLRVERPYNSLKVSTERKLKPTELVRKLTSRSLLIKSLEYPIPRFV